MPAHHAFWPKRLPHQLTAPQTSLWMNLQISALRYPQKVALVFMGRTWSYAQLQLEAEIVASALRKMYILSLHDALPMIGRASCRERVYLLHAHLAQS